MIKIREIMRQSKIKADFAILSLFAVVAFLFVTSSLNTALNKNAQSASALLSAQQELQQNTAERKPEKKSFKTPLLNAKAFVVYDANKKEIIAQKNAEVPLPLASLTKLFTALLSAKYLQDDTVTMSKQDLETEGYSGLKDGTHWRANTLAAYMLVVSSNDAAVALKRALEKKTGRSFLELVKGLRKEKGLRQSFAVNPSGLDESDSLAGAYSSALEMAKLLNEAYKDAPNILSYTSKKEMAFKDLDGNIYDAKNTNKIVYYIFNILAGKTGFTDLAGGNLAVLFEPEPNHPIAIVVLSSGKETRFEDVRKLYEATLKYLK